MTANKNPRYRKFIADRNSALEVLLQKKLIQLDGILTNTKASMLDLAASVLRVRKPSPQETMDQAHFPMRMQNIADAAALDSLKVALSLRRIAYIVSYAGEIEALARLKGQPLKAKADHSRLAHIQGLESPSGGGIKFRLRLYYQALARKAVQAFELGLVSEESDQDILTRVANAFPKQKTLVRPKKKLQKPKREAAPPRRRMEDSLVVGFIDDDAWDEAVQTYLQNEIQIGRSPEDTVKVQVGKDKIERYVWEVEKEVTQDFVELVRRGQIDGARENGIQDFVWISVIDDKTDECCAWRDGLTTSEISRQLKGKYSGDECRTEVPPAHFNCRCDLAPVTEALPETEKEDLGDFETWFTQK